MNRIPSRRWSGLLNSLILLIVSVHQFPATASQWNVENDTLAAKRWLKPLEVPADKYVPVPLEGRKTSPAYHFSRNGFFSTQVNVDESGENIVGDAANEPSIAIDPTQYPRRIAIGWRQFDSQNNNFRQAGYGYSADGGRTWVFPGVLEPGIFRSDPVLDFDSNGQFYYNSLTVDGVGNFMCNVFKSSDGGTNWDAGTFAWGGDKQWMAIDKTGSMGNDNIYAFWTQGYSVCFPSFFTRSVNHGDSYEACEEITDSPFWGTLDVGPDGELYVCGAGGNGFVVVRSSTARDSSQTVSWDLSTDVDLGGDMTAFGGFGCPNPEGLLGQAWIATDRSTGPSRGNVYLLCSVDPFSGSDPLDVMLARSTDGGATWSEPVRVNDDSATNAWQWFGTMSVAPNGRIDVVWLDTRDDPGGLNSSLYYSSSNDGGVTWSKNERLSESFDPHLGWPQQNKMGDYFDMISNAEGTHIAWAGTFNGEQDVYYGFISPLITVDAREERESMPESFFLSQNYPNPFNPTTHFGFDLPAGQAGISDLGFVSLSIYDLLGREVATLVNEEMQSGRHSITWDATGVASGVYVYRLQVHPVSGLPRSFVNSKKLLLVR